MKNFITLLFLFCSIGHVLGEPNLSLDINHFKIDKNVYCITSVH